MARRAQKHTYEIQLEDGVAIHVGEGLFAITQRDELEGMNARVVISMEDVRRMVSSIAPLVPAGSGSSHCVLAAVA
jgi:hypothetical protein